MDTSEEPKGIWNPAWPKPRNAILRLLVIVIVLLPCEWVIFAFLVGDWKLNIADGTEESVRHLVEGLIVFVAAVSVLFLASLLPVFGWLRRQFSWRAARRALISLVSLVTLWALFCTEENIRGRRTWNRYRRALEARGAQLDFKAFIPRPVPDEQNFAATPLVKSWFPNLKPETWQDNYRRAEGRVKIEDHRRMTDLVAWERAFAQTNSPRNVEGGPLDPESRAKAAPEILEALKANEPIFTELRAASRRPYSRYPVNYDVEDPFTILLPHVSSVRQVCRRLQLRACAELAVGHSTEALEDVNLIFRLADSLNEEPFIVSYLVRIACVQNALQPVWEGLAEHHWSAAQLQELQAHLQQYNFVADVRPGFESERAAGILIADLIRKHGLGYLINYVGPGSPSQSDLRVANWLGVLVPSGWLFLEQYNLSRASQTLLDGTMDPSQRRVFPDRTEANARELEGELHGRNFVASFIHHRSITALTAPNLSRVIIKAAVGQTVSDEAALACALERYRSANGRFPEQLDMLAPQFIPQVPDDVITGEPYKYRRTDDGRFVLYSVGWNEKDDGGVPGKTDFDDKEGDWVWQYPSSN